MKITIRQAQEDSYGNTKENIFLAFDEEEKYLGSGFVFPTINHHQTVDTPYLIFLSINVEKQPQGDEIRKMLFDSLKERAEALHKEKADLKCRFYAGFEYDEKMMDFYLQQGFEEDYSIFMEADIDAECENKLCQNMKAANELPQNIEVTEFSVLGKEEFENYKMIYDEIFVTPLDEGFVEAQKEDASFKNFNFYVDGENVGSFSLRVEDGCGWIETLFVLEKYRGKGISKVMMNYIHQYFIKQGCSKAKLEVWELDKRAVNLYKSFGYKETQKNCMFPGITM